MIPSQSGKTFLITGATSGIGLEASVALARAGGSLTLVGRDAAKTAAVVEDVKRRSGGTQVDSLLCDFSSQAGVRRLAAEFRAKHDRLHVLINNAGSVNVERKLTADGVEATFAVNHLGYFLLTTLLLDLLEKSAPARVVNVSSVGHRAGTMDLDDLGFERGGYQIMRAYHRSKLGNVLFTRELAKRESGKGVTVNALHPGVVSTSIWGGAPGWAKPLLAIAKLFMDSPEKGGSRITYLAADPEVEGKTGLYFEKNKVSTPGALAQDEALATRLWGVSEHLVAKSA